MRLPKSPEQKRADAAERQRRSRARRQKQEALDAAIDYSVGLGPKPKRPMPEVSNRDLAQRIVEKYARYLDTVGDDELADKEVVAALNLALKAQNVIEARDKFKAKTGMQLELAAGLAAILSGQLPVAQPRQLDDGNTIEGDYEAVENVDPRAYEDDDEAE
jgi:hypothetical protein